MPISFVDKKMSRLWQQICFYCTVLITLTYPHVFAEDTLRLNLCGEQLKNARSLVFVNTLDGKISALDANNYGKIQWTLNFNNGPMLSSSIHSRELNNNGQWIRLIPSLNGGLYKFDGENLETVPITADQLLHSSFRFSDDLVFSGGKELHSYGVAANTGEILYQCNVFGCKNNTKRQEYVDQDVLVVQRFQQTVRAVEARTGNERWNFSVGQYDLELIPPEDVFCSNKATTADVEIKVIIPEGLIWAIDKNDPTIKLWQYKFDSPIVTIWREDVSKISITSGPLEKIDLFDSSQWIWGLEYSAIRPGLYLGMHEKQLYVQESHNYKDSKYVQHIKYPWKPYPAAITAVANTLLDKDGNDEVSIIEANEAQNAIALSVLYNSEYINGNGFYLYSTNELTNDKQCNRSNSNVLFITDMEKFMLNYTENTGIPTRIILSLWHWWREILIISFTTAFLLNFMLTQRLLKARTTTTDAMLPSLIIEKSIEIKKSDSTNDDSKNVNNFKSHYLTDFEPVDCLGKGGYGVVFEARNKIDDCNYAIKRIALSNSQDSRERVLREVKALAKLDHHNIVRYFHAWLECPPSGWQEEHDQQWIDKLKCSAESFSEIIRTETKPNHSVCIDVSQTEPSSIESTSEGLKFNNMDANDDSYITFEISNEKQYSNDSIYINNCGIENSDLSLSSSITEKKLPNISEIDHSESILFEETDNNTTTERKKRQISLSLDLNKTTPDTQTSAKMFLYIQMQLCQRLSLKEWLKQYASRDFSEILNIFQQIVDAVEYVHLQGLIHRDLKPSNIFFAYDDKIKIGDFGLVTAMTEGYDRAHTPATETETETVSLKSNIHTACVGTHLYMSPEQMNGQIYNYKVDIYSLGIIFFELLTPFFTDMERIIELSNLRKSIFPKDFAKNHPAEYNLLKMMLDEDPTKRPTTLGIKAKPPLQNYEKVCFNMDTDSKWHFELPQLTRHSSVTSSSNNSELPENIN